GTLFAFILVALGIIVLRRKDPDRPRPFRTPWVPFLPLVSIGFCIYLILSLPLLTKLRFVAWLVVGGLIYFLYSVRHRRVGRVGVRTLAYFLVSTALSAGIGLALVNAFQPGAGLPPDVREQLMTTYRAQAQGLQAAGTTHFGVDTFVSMVPRNPIQAAAGM